MERESLIFPALEILFHFPGLPEREFGFPEAVWTLLQTIWVQQLFIEKTIISCAKDSPCEMESYNKSDAICCLNLGIDYICFKVYFQGELPNI